MAIQKTIELLTPNAEAALKQLASQGVIKILQTNEANREARQRILALSEQIRQQANTPPPTLDEIQQEVKAVRGSRLWTACHEGNYWYQCVN